MKQKVPIFTALHLFGMEIKQYYLEWYSTFYCLFIHLFPIRMFHHICQWLYAIYCIVWTFSKIVWHSGNGIMAISDIWFAFHVNNSHYPNSEYTLSAMSNIPLKVTVELLSSWTYKTFNFFLTSQDCLPQAFSNLSVI